MLSDYSGFESLLPESYLFSNDYEKAITERWVKNSKRKRKSDNSDNKKCNKKQKINEDENIEITTKTSIPIKKPSGIFGPSTTKVDDLANYITLEEAFDKILDQDKSKFLYKYKKNIKEDDNNKKYSDDMLSLFDCQSPSNSEPNSNNTNDYNIDSNDNMETNDFNMDYTNQYEEEVDNINTSECFLCTIGNTSHDEIYAKHLNVLKQIYVENRARCKNEDLAKLLHLYFIENVHKKNSDNDLPLLTEEMALNHIENRGYSHTLNASEHVVSSVRTWKKIFECLSQVLFTSDKQLDKKHFDALEKTQKILDVLYHRDVKKLNFNDPDTVISCTGALFQRTILPPHDEKILRQNKQTKKNLSQERTILL